MVSSENFQFSILDSTGIPLPEYENPFPSEEDLAKGVASVYIETPPAAAPQNFTIDVRTIKPINYTESMGYYFDAYFDGVRSAHGTSIGIFTSPRKGDGQHIIMDCFHEVDPTGRNFVDKELVFKSMDMNNDGPSLAAMRRDAASGQINPQDVGSIRLRFADIVELPSSSSATTRHQFAPTKLNGFNGQVSEKALKGSSSTHSIGAGKTMAVKSAKTQTLKTSEKWHDVKFLYRSRAALQNIGIIKADPKSEKKVKPDPSRSKTKPKSEVITIDDSDDEAPPPAPTPRSAKPAQGVKRERAPSVIRVKAEKKVKQDAPAIVDMTGDD